MKNEQKTILIIMSVVVVIMLGKQAGLFATFGLLDDYAIYDDFSAVENVFTIEDKYIDKPTRPSGCSIGGTYMDGQCTEYWRRPGLCTYPGGIRACSGEKWNTEVSAGGSINLDIQSEKLIIGPGGITGSGYGNGFAKMTATQDFLGNDLKINAKYVIGGGDQYSAAHIDIIINNQTIWTLQKPAQAATTHEYLIEIKSSRLDPSNAVLFINGGEVKEITNLETLYFGLNFPSSQSLSGYIIVDNMKYRIPFSCKIATDEHLVSENYPAGSVIELTPDFRITENGCQVEKFCLAHPAIIESTTAQGTTSDYNAEIYQKLVSGNSLTVPSDQSYELFFIAKEASTGFCTEYAGRAGPFHMEVNTTSTLEQYIKPGETARWETNPISLAELPFITKATFTIMAEKDGVEQTKEDIIVFRK